jgi:hypothetical protein
MIAFNTHLFHVASLFTSTEQARYYLGGVYIEPHKSGGVTMTATDGHMLIHLHDPDGACDKPVILTAWASRHGRQLRPGKRMLRRIATGTVETRGKFTLNLHDIEAGVSCTDQAHLAGSLLCETVDGSFPEYRRVIPAMSKLGLSGQFKPALIASVAAAAKELGVTDLIFRQKDKNSPAIALLGPRAFAVLMPRYEQGDEELALPSWFAS